MMLLWERLRFMIGLEEDAACGEVSGAAEDKASGESVDIVSSLRSIGKGGGISILGNPREALRSRKLWPLARLTFSVGAKDGPDGNGIPGPRGGGRSLRLLRVKSSSSSAPGALADSLDLFRGVDVLAGNAKFIALAVCISSKLLSPPVAFLCGNRSRDKGGIGEPPGGLGVPREIGICNKGGRKRSDSVDEVSSSNSPRREDGSLAGARGLTVFGEEIGSSMGSSDEVSPTNSVNDLPRTVSNSQGLSCLGAKSWRLLNI